LEHKELLEEFKKLNNVKNIKDWCPLVGDECEQYADTSKPIIKVTLENDSWLRVYIDKKYKEITWY
jgi:hypothetical protein